MTYAYKEAYQEIYYILQNMEEEDVAKIPQNIIDVFEKNRVKHYQVNIDPALPLKDQQIKEETKAILALLYRKYWSDPEMREQLEKEFYEQLEKENAELKMRKEEQVIQEEAKEIVVEQPLINDKLEEPVHNLPIQQEKVDFINKIINWFKNIFNHN